MTPHRMFQNSLIEDLSNLCGLATQVAPVIDLRRIHLRTQCKQMSGGSSPAMVRKQKRLQSSHCNDLLSFEKLYFYLPSWSDLKKDDL